MALSVADVQRSQIVASHVRRRRCNSPGHALGVHRQMLAGEVRVAAHHLRALPAAEFLQGVQGRPGLDVPAGPGVPQVVPPEVGNPCALQRRPPGLGVGLR